jgi:hypothetical protein
MNPYEIIVLLVGFTAILAIWLREHIKDNVNPTKHQPYTPYKEDVAPTSHVSGVSWDKQKMLWRVRFRVDGVRKHFGYFEDREAAEKYCLLVR